MTATGGPMTAQRPGRPVAARGTHIILSLMCGLAACSPAPDTGSEVSGSATVGRPEPTPAATSVESPVARLRDDDETDVDPLARAMAASAVGDERWIPVMARLRVGSWLATRYPGRYDLHTLYAGETVESALANEAEQLALGIYLDEPLPALLSVEQVATLGQLVELDVTLDAGPATVRSEHDDSSRGVLPGGRHRGLFVIGRDGNGFWRIHSITELQAAEPVAGQETSS